MSPPQPGSPTSGPTTRPLRKRRRVSAACMNCRKTRRRCDGSHPSCDSCVSNGKDCTYAPPRRKRGLPLGYSKALESSLAYLLEQSSQNAALLDYLLDSENSVFQKQGRQLRLRWTESRFREKMCSLDLTLSDESTYDASAPRSINHYEEQGDSQNCTIPTPANSDSTLVASPSAIGIRALNHVEPLAGPGSLKLPPNWRQLLEVYFSYTHCWIPIMDENAIRTTALRMPPEGINLDSWSALPPSYVELWASMALASFQVNSNGNAEVGDCLSSSLILFTTSQRMMPCEQQELRLPHVRALLLHSLVLIGQGKVFIAWLIIRRATRVVLDLRETNKLNTDESRADQDCKRQLPSLTALAACIMLDTFISAHLGYQPCSELDLQELDSTIERLGQGLGPQDRNPAFHPSFGSPLRFCPFKTLKQLYKITRFMRLAILEQTSRSHLEHCPGLAHALVESLDTDFACCNSIIADLCTPMSHSALVVHVAFLLALRMTSMDSAALLLTTQHRVVKRLIGELGVEAMPPVISVLLTASDKFSPVESDSSKIEWNKKIQSLRAVWQQFNQPSLAGSGNDQSQGVSVANISDLYTLDYGLAKGTGSSWDTCEPPEIVDNEFYLDSLNGDYTYLDLLDPLLLLEAK